jgi:PAS domain S-box-containing protein
MPVASEHSSLDPDPDAASASRPPDSPFARLAARESSLWKLALIVLIALALGLAVVSWRQAQTSPEWFGVLPVGLVVLVILFGIYAWSKTRELSELRGLVRGLEQRAAAPPDLDQLEKLFGLVQRSQQGYRDLIDTFDDLLFSVSLDGQILAANRSLAGLLGFPFTELVGRPLDEFVDLAEGNGRAAAARAIPQLLERRHWSGTLRVRLKRDGSTRFLQCTVHALVREERDHGLCVLAHDVTQERENEARFTELFETLQEGVYLATADGKFENANPALAGMLGYQSPEELLNRPLSEFLLLPEEWEAERRRLADSGSVRAHEVTLRRRDGSALVCLHAPALVRDAAGRVLRYQGTLVDITERREIEQRLHREQEFARRLVESFPDLVIAVDREGRYTFVSPRSKALLGFEPEEIVGTPMGQRMDPQDRREVRALHDAIISGQTSGGSIEYLVERRDGEMRLFRATASPLFDAAGHIEGLIASARDITEAKRMEQQLIQTERLAAMGQMIAGVAHELNNPLTAVLGVTELLRDSAANDATRRQVELAHRQARRAAQIVQSLLSFARPPQPRKICVHLAELIQRSLQLHEHSLRSNRIAVDFVPKPDLPAVLGDASQLTQVFLNLIINAEQAILEVRDHGNLRIRMATLGDRVVVTFQDDGVGIRRENLSKLFDPFFTTKRPGRGTGLGLSICLAILREHNGQIEAQPLADGGSVFTVSLPVASGAEMVLAPPSATSLPEMDSAPADRLIGIRVLVVDDEEGIRELVRDGLGVRGIHVDVAPTAEDALSRLERHNYDAVLCDLNLQSNSSHALTARELYARVDADATGMFGVRKPLFLFMTGEVAGTALEELAGSGVQTLQKPFRISELIAILTDAMAATAVGNPPNAVRK